MEDCIFCKIIKGEIPSYKIYEDEKVYAFLDIAKDAYGHTLVIPKKHCVNVLDCDDETLAAVMSAAAKIARHYTEDCGFGGVNLLHAGGKAAQQSVFHLHFHLIPRKSDDGMNLFPLETGRDLDLAEMHRKLKFC